jgi:hypothetical protein
MTASIPSRAGLDTAGEKVAVESSVPWVTRLIEEGAAGQLRLEAPALPTVTVRVEASRRPFDVRGWEPLTRGAWVRDGEVVMEDVVTAGFDLLVRAGDVASFTYRWRPPVRSHLAAWGLRSRFHLLARAALLQYPAMWWAGTRNRAPLHATVVATAAASPLLAGPGGVGKSTLLRQELAVGGEAVSDNLCVGDGAAVWGVVEPLRVEGGMGRRMAHGRRESPMRGRAASLIPDRILVLRRGTGDRTRVRRCSSETAARSLMAGTYMAGELRRFWSFASTLSLGTGVGPVHPPVATMARAFAEALPCAEVTLARRPGADLGDLLEVERLTA